MFRRILYGILVVLVVITVCFGWSLLLQQEVAALVPASPLSQKLREELSQECSRHTSLSLSELPSVNESYALLGLQVGASTQAVRDATLERVRRHRDGAHRGDAMETTRFLQANLAFETLLHAKVVPNESASAHYMPSFVLWSGWQIDWWPAADPCHLPCHFTAARADFQLADYLVFLGPVLPDDERALPEEKPPHQRWVLFTAESNANTPALHNQRLMDRMDLVVSTNRLRSHITVRYCPEPQLFAHLCSAPLPTKDATAPLVWFASNCDQSPEAWRRTAYVRELMKHIQVDSYGKCLRNRQLGEEEAAIYDRVAQVVAVARHYKFYLAFENSVEAGYVSEKVITGLRAHAVPIYLGAPDIEEHLPYPDMVVRADRFASPAALASHILMLNANQTAYNHYLRYRRLYAEKVPMRASLRTNCSQPFCQLCREALRERLHAVE
jgi:Glycosyltransferase family 10 (fucosyltransferase) C-term/Fucosyltransferase, N-terminal